MNLTNDSASSGSLSMSVWVEGLKLISTMMGGIGVKDDQRWVRAGPSRAATYEGDVPRFRDGRGHVRHVRLSADPWVQKSASRRSCFGRGGLSLSFYRVRLQHVGIVCAPSTLVVHAMIAIPVKRQAL
jgi:hypothetical protein